MRLKIVCIIITSYLFLPGLMKTANAAESYIKPGLKIYMGYNDNISLNQSSAFNSSSLMFISPELLIARKSKIWDMGLYSRLDVKKYYSIPDFNTDNKYLNLYGSRLFELGRLTGDMTYNRDTTLEDFIDDTGSIDTKLTRRETTGFNPAWVYKLSELSQVRLSYRFRYVNYLDVSAIYNDYKTYVTSASFKNQWSRTTSIYMNVDSSKYIKDSKESNTRIDSNDFSIGFKHDISEKYNINASIGQNKSDIKTTLNLFSPTLIQQYRSTSKLYSLNFEKKNEITTFNFGYSITVTPDSQGRLNNRNEFVFKTNMILSRQSNFDFNIRYFSQEVTGSNDSSGNRKYLSINPIFNYRLNKKIMISASYHYQEMVFALQNTVEKSNSVMLTYSYMWGKQKI